ncbi:hypothetical protein DSD19_04645 [Rhodovulum sp. BSW8]|uniref:hypothetical protein n=1 Tax=Rhodovulum sp. BSW8 TaxID=2259645 RepID=UPI000DE4EEBA|nr:hypothetical protein [Rhodovulum sp. BSW8]RBO54669.1 hypothetical protein DSD19_04645 [Rhodovulum sp. BSW8]
MPDTLIATGRFTAEVTLAMACLTSRENGSAQNQFGQKGTDMTETVEIKLSIGMGHREGQESPATEIERVLCALAGQIGQGQLANWRALCALGGEVIGEAHLHIRAGKDA